MVKHALIVGVRGYAADSGIPPVRHGIADAVELARVLREGCGFTVDLLVDDHPGASGPATRDSILECLFSIQRNFRDDDIVVLALFGHGVWLRDNALPPSDSWENQFFLPSDASLGSTRTYIGFPDLIELMTGMPALRRVLIVDTCRNDPFDDGDGRSRSAGIGTRDIELEETDKGTLLILSSCSPGQKAVEREAQGHGVFAYHLIEAIQNAPKTPKSGWTEYGALDFEHLAEVVKEQVANDQPGDPQTPTFQRIGADGPVVLGEWRKGGPGPLPAIDPSWTLHRRQPPRPQGPSSRGILGALAAGVIVLAIGTLAIRLLGTEAVAGACPAGGPLGATVVLMDPGGSPSQDARATIANKLRDEASFLPGGYLLEIRAMTDGDADGTVTFSGCAPLSSAFTPGTDRASERWLEAFDAAVVTPLLDATGVPASPRGASIMAAAREAARDRMGLRVRGDQPHRLVIVSDMVEVMPGYSQLDGATPSYEAFQSLPVYDALRTDLNGATVQIYYVVDERNRRFSTDTEQLAHRTFWLHWAIDSNRSSFEVYTILD
ncbi:MAG: caspase family protein [Bauldia sp.]